ncbi:hypothetical protein DT594_17375 [Halopseudomonas laoshanensis]|uniref:Lipoprotein n=1 Tax=Halopseudomonas laoshanensis TaxID=2268758 RepID=A0A7V7GP32_9GAMM|nr:hypothetical protein [Halopseudomonas laoshanensis]KAA0691347.1 hypothetical protein DT594_17375 [Halopseudomonas laoshanensis]
MLKTILTLSALLLISGCTDDSHTQETQTPAVTEPSQSDYQTTDQWVGKWIGVEGLVLDISENQAVGPGHYLLEMRYGLDADQSGTFEGQATEQGISFSREGDTYLLRAGNGEDTGMKWLAEKQDCLIVQSGEGYCRD